MSAGKTNEGGKELHYDIAKNRAPSTVRKLGDKRTLCLQLDTEGVKAPTTPDAVLESAMFLLRRYENPFVSQYHEVQHPRHSIQFMSLGHPILKHTYLIPTTNDQLFASNNDLAHRMEDLRIKLDGLTLKEMEKVPEAERPIEFARVRDAHESGSILKDTFSLPVDWTFYDDEVLEELGVAWERRDGDDDDDDDDLAGTASSDGQAC
ncbi:uncharacterized protein J4E79_005958 [Alternaria viburni]|uniref:uncharacterized protein n=1 Tax=Alternaria viburni TaxID=566460 RepID=UPI0020C40832|nr:uncharacterized protein J4E79_005958 [Alternaria viburni]KAI4660153.1 hypothetical protein J4E79_005958 [Alternaria viburni]